MVNPFEETAIAGDISLTPHDRVQQERDLRIGETANMYMNTGVTSPTQEATRYVDWKYPTVFEDLTPGKSGHPYEGGWGPEHKWARPTNLGYNPLKHILDYSINTVKPAVRDMIGFPQPSWVDEYTNRDVPQIGPGFTSPLFPGQEGIMIDPPSSLDDGIIMDPPSNFDDGIEVDPDEWMGDQSKIDLDEIFRMYPDLDIWRLIQNLDARGIEYANRGGIIGLL
jgi:hypothetical protein